MLQHFDTSYQLTTYERPSVSSKCTSLHSLLPQGVIIIIIGWNMNVSIDHYSWQFAVYRVG